MESIPYNKGLKPLFYRYFENFFAFIINLLTFISIILLILIIAFIFKESVAVFQYTTVIKFIIGKSWHPLADPPAISILPMLLATIAVSFLALLIAVPLGVGCALFISNVCSENTKRIIRPLIDVLVGIPSVIYGFIGMMVLVKFFETRFSVASGESLLAGGIILAIMILPFVVSTCDETMSKIAHRYIPSSQALGVNNWYMLAHLILPISRKGILAGTILALARAMGETMAVMMVAGNSPLMPISLFQQVMPIPALIALEMGSAPIGSPHYHALFGAGLVLMALLLVINVGIFYIRKKIDF